jgi:hypothetical protein
MPTGLRSGDRLTTILGSGREAAFMQAAWAAEKTHKAVKACWHIADWANSDRSN